MVAQLDWLEKVTVAGYFLALIASKIFDEEYGFLWSHDGNCFSSAYSLIATVLQITRFCAIMIMCLWGLP